MSLLSLHPFIQSTIGGIFIGLSAILMMWGLNRIAGISNIIGGLLSLEGLKEGWRWWFLAGLSIGPFLLLIYSQGLTMGLGFPMIKTPLLILAGLIVGVGVTLSNGCTSGHGVCGLARLSPRSLVATITFILTGIITVAVMKGF